MLIVYYQGIADENNKKMHYATVRTLTIQNTGHQMLARVQSHQNSPSLLVRIQNGAATLEDSLAGSYKTRHTLTI